MQGFWLYVYLVQGLVTLVYFLLKKIFQNAQNPPILCFNHIYGFIALNALSFVLSIAAHIDKIPG